MVREAPAGGRLGRAQGAAQVSRRRRSSPRSCSRRPRASCASRPSGPWAWPSACTKASSWARRARSVSSPTCVPTRPGCPTTPSPRCARTSPGATARTALPAEPNVFKSKKSAQDAHEAIRPTSTKFDPETVRQLMTASGGRDAARDRGPGQAVHADLEPLRGLPDDPGRVRPDRDRHRGGPGRAARHRPGDQGRRLPRGLRRDGGGRRLRGREHRQPARGAARARCCGCVEAKPEQHFTQPPPRFSEATLVKELEEKGIGRPSTYAAILSTVQDRGYVEKREGRLLPHRAGGDGQRPAGEELPRDRQHRLHRPDGGAPRRGGGGRGRSGCGCCATSTRPSSRTLEKAKVEMRDVKREEIPTEHVCEKCGKVMVIKWGRNGHFLACSGYPECRNTKEYMRAADGSIKVVRDHPRDQREVPHLRLDHGDPPRPLRRVPGLLAATPSARPPAPSRSGVACPTPRLRRLPHREALAAGQGLLRLRQLLEDQVRLRLLGPPGPPPLPQLQRRLHRREGLQGRHPPPLHRRRLRLHRRQGRRRRRSRRRRCAPPAPAPPPRHPDPDAKAS